MRSTQTSRAGRLALGAIAALSCGAVAHAASPPPLPVDPCATPSTSDVFYARTIRRGAIDLIFTNAKDARVDFFECVGDGVKPVTSKHVTDPTGAREAVAVTWSCDRLSRRFGAVGTLPDGSTSFGSFSVRTPSCANRFALFAPRRVRPGATARVRVVDRWGIGGIRSELCIGPVRGAKHCTTLRFPRAVSVAGRRFRASERGRWRVELHVRDTKIATSVAVGGKGRARERKPPIVYAAGDSTMEGVDSFLADELGDAYYVHSDPRLGSGITRYGAYWKWHAKSQTKRLRQRYTVFSIGVGADTMPIPTALGVLTTCCDEPWVQEYATRVRGIMQTFLRHGRGRVVWMTAPEPRYAPHLTHQINIAVERAAQGLSGVKVLRIDKLLSPNGYQDVISWQGQNVRVREGDGVHLNVAGTAIAAKAAAEALHELR